MLCEGVIGQVHTLSTWSLKLFGGKLFKLVLCHGVHGFFGQWLYDSLRFSDYCYNMHANLSIVIYKF